MYKKAFVMTYAIFAIVLLLFVGAVTHYFLSKWSEPLAFVLTFLNIYLILFFWAQYRALQLTPNIVSNHVLHLSTGFTSFCTIPLNEITDVENCYSVSEDIEKENTFMAVVLDEKLNQLQETEKYNG
ncbi:hypothetical protein [Peribacillus simplex]|uniref:hypothetical protein n=1 Tax=Peribacillus simplex TaxID=1478 RepID=UPI003D289D8A